MPKNMATPPHDGEFKSVGPEVQDAAILAARSVHLPALAGWAAKPAIPPRRAPPDTAEAEAIHG